MRFNPLLTIVTLTIFLVLPNSALAYTVKGGDTLWKISQANGITLQELRYTNNKWDSSLKVGEYLKITESVSASDKDLLARLVHAEAQGESYAGKVAVATVVLNRVDNKDFPNTIKEVIYETYGNGAIYAFSPVQNGTIKQAADTDSKRAVSEAIEQRGQGAGSLFFYNPKTASSKWIADRPVTVVIGNHTFAK